MENGVVNDGDCIDAKYVVIAKVNHVNGGKDSCVDFCKETWYLLLMIMLLLKSHEVTKYICENCNYHGSIMTNTYISMATISNDWDYLVFLQISRNIMIYHVWHLVKHLHQDVVGFRKRIN